MVPVLLCAGGLQQGEILPQAAGGGGWAAQKVPSAAWVAHRQGAVGKLRGRLGGLPLGPLPSLLTSDLAHADVSQGVRGGVYRQRDGCEEDEEHEDHEPQAGRLAHVQNLLDKDDGHEVQGEDHAKHLAAPRWSLTTCMRSPFCRHGRRVGGAAWWGEVKKAHRLCSH